jgi:hypothetical protein
MSDLLPQLIVLALGGTIAPPLLLLLTSLFWDSRRPLHPTPPPSGSGTSLFCAALGISGLTPSSPRRLPV